MEEKLIAILSDGTEIVFKHPFTIRGKAKALVGNDRKIAITKKGCRRPHYYFTVNRWTSWGTMESKNSPPLIKALDGKKLKITIEIDEDGE